MADKQEKKASADTLPRANEREGGMHTDYDTTQNA